MPRRPGLLPPKTTADQRPRRSLADQARRQPKDARKEQNRSAEQPKRRHLHKFSTASERFFSLLLRCRLIPITASEFAIYALKQLVMLSALPQKTLRITKWV